MTKRSVVAAVLLVGVVAVRAANAEEETAALPQAAAEQLFSDGVRLLKAGSLAEACAKLAQSQRLDPSAGTLLNLADCYERRGQTASAWATFKAAARASAERNRHDWERVAERHARALEKRLSYLVVRITPHSTEEITVTLDGIALGRSAFGASFPIDPGAHAVEAKSEAHRPWKVTVEVPADGGHVEVVIPPLEQASEPAHAARPAPSTAPPTRTSDERAPFTTMRVVGVATMGIGALSLGATAVLAIAASSQRSDVEAACPEYPRCSGDLPQATRRQLVEDNGHAESLATYATVAAIAGAVLVVGGAVLYLAASSRRTEPERSRAWARPGVLTW